MKKGLLLFLFLMMLAPLGVHAEIIINEAMASNGVFLNERHDDWIELYNNGSDKVSLEGWYLSNDPFNLHRWSFPAKTSIKKDGYLVIYCTDDTVITNGPSGTIYADFKLSAKGESVYMTDPEGNTTQVTFGAQYGNVSSGIPAGGEGWHYLEQSTPGAANSSAAYDARAEAPVIETAAGFYSESIFVTLRCAEGQEIRYTTDSSEPGRDSKLYTEPIEIKKTTVLRARAFGEDLLGSVTVGSTFFINDASAKVSTPVVSVYTDRDYFFSNKMGILVEGNAKNPNYNRNWEYPVTIEYFDENKTRVIAQTGSVKVNGGSSRQIRQKSLAIYARSMYGGSDSFDYAFFENRDYDSYSTILLRSTASDFKSCRMRDAVFGEMSDGLGLYYQAGRAVVVYINGEYYGHYNLREKPNKYSLAQWEGITDPDTIKGVDILMGTGMNATDVVQGSSADWVELMNYCKSNKLDTPEKLQYVLDRVDIDSLYNYAIFNIIIGNYDIGNTRVYRFPGGKWKFMLHDIESGCMGDKTDPLGSIIRSKSSKTNNYPHYILAALLEQEEYKDLFLRRTAEIVKSNFLYSEQVKPIYEKWSAWLEELLPRHLTKFRNFDSIKDWRVNVKASMYYARIRPRKMIDQICSKLGVKSAAKQEYFGEVFKLLDVYNAKGT